jgi:pyruvate/2-oxoacid:ferredoxin oxidoreductase beta subunit
MPEILIPTGRWKIAVDPASEGGAVRLSGRAFSDRSNAEQKMETIYLTHEQARELVAGLNAALRELELERNASVARAAEGDGWDYSLSGA